MFKNLRVTLKIVSLLMMMLCWTSCVTKTVPVYKTVEIPPYPTNLDWNSTVINEVPVKYLPTTDAIRLAKWVTDVTYL